MTSTELRRRDTDHRTSPHLSQLIWSAGALLVVAAFAAGCDTTAKISFPSRSFSDIHSTGMIAPANKCGTLGTQGGATTKLRFAMVADDGTVIRPPRKGGDPLDSGEVSLDENKMTYDESGAIYQHPDLKCGGGGNGNGNMQSQAIQPFDGGCSGQYSCKVGVSSDGKPWMKRCHLSSKYTVKNVKHTADVDKHQFFGVLVENAGSLEGFPAGNSSGWYYDADGNGEAETKIKPQYPNTRATDRNGNRITALKNLVPNWKNVQKEGDAESRETFFGLWTFSGSKNPSSVVQQAAEQDSVWTDKASVVDDATTGSDSGGAFPSRTQQGSRGNVLEAAESLIKNQFSGETLRDTDKTLVLFTDGPPEVHPDRHNVTTDKVIQAAKQNNVRIFIVHLDEKVGDGDAESVFDDYQYYLNQEDQCGGPEDCRPHETCRTVRGYSTQRNGDVTAGTTGRYHDQGEEATYCMPQRRSDGRTGPLSIYSKIACATKGGYQYVKTNTELTWAMSWLPYTMDGLWEATVDVQELSRGNYTANSPIRLQARYNVQIGDRGVSLDLSQNGGGGEDIPEAGDARSVIVTGGK